MRNRTLSLTLFSAGLMLGVLALPAVRADKTPRETTTSKPAQPANGEGRQGFPMLDRMRTMVDELKLSDDQKGKVDGYFDEARTQLKKLREDASGDRQAMMPKYREVFEKLRENVASVLTDDQKEQMKTKVQALLQRGGDAGARLRETLDKLNLTDDQKEKVHAILEDVQKKAKDIREAGGDGAREKMGELMKDTRAKIADILTDDQKEKFKELAAQAGRPDGAPRRAEKKPDPQ
jgi:Spy/CpxP family protein refolding chaperone